MKVIKAEHLISAVDPAQYPRVGYPEVALAGRSNVGKSSVINALVNRKSLARVGSTPGKTRIINFYNINDSLMIVDLPGYGYAKVSREERKSWGRLAETYLTTRERLRAIILVLDIRHPPTGDDLIMHRFIRESGKRCIIVANKTDKIRRYEIKPRLDQIARDLGLADGSEIIPFSGMDKTGVDELWKRLEAVLD
jgi:GTP-binding protein